MGSRGTPYAVEENPEDFERIREQVYPDSLPLRVLAKLIVAQLNRRKKYLPKATFEDPQWLMILDLFIASEERRDVSVSSLCFASGVPPTTALRHIRALAAKGLFERVSHPRDRRICHVRLSESARNQMIGYLVSVASGGIELDDGPALRAAH
jgi:DNA-binding MarR family transcriptional regulator